VSNEHKGARLQHAMDRLIHVSRANHYNVYQAFDWPDALPGDRPWMSPELLSLHGTEDAERLSDDQRLALSRCEACSFFSLNVHGIRELLLEVVKRIHAVGFEGESEYLHHFIGEENQHMWFFAQFCRRYGKLYPDKRLKLADQAEPDLQAFTVFARILVFEELVDHFNARMATDDALPALVQQLNRAHHREESRHIAFGRMLLVALHDRLRARHAPERLADLGTYLQRYMTASVQSLYNPSAYRDAGLPDPYGLRERLLAHPSRRAAHARMLKHTVDFLVKHRIVSDTELPS
jgi:P-aminobenzoate N-oxygenase AurF